MRFHIGFRCRFERVVNLHLKLEDINRALQIRIDIAGRIAVSCVALRSLFPFAGREVGTSIRQVKNTAIHFFIFFMSKILHLS